MRPPCVDGRWPAVRPRAARRALARRLRASTSASAHARTRQQVRRDPPPVLGRRSDVVDRAISSRAESAARRQSTRPRRAPPRSWAAARPSAPRCRRRCAAPRGPPRPAMTTFEIACAARVPDLSEPLPARDRRDLDGRRSARPAQRRSAVAGVELRERHAARVRDALPSTTIASAAASTGSVSPAGEALAMLPPIVPRFWICDAADLARGGHEHRQPLRTSARSDQSVYVPSAPIDSTPSRTAMLPQLVEPPEVQEARAARACRS